MSTWLNRGASGGLAGAWRQKRNQPTANSPNRLTHRNTDGPCAAAPMCAGAPTRCWSCSAPTS